MARKKKTLVNPELHSLLNSFTEKKRTELNDMIISSLVPSEPSPIPKSAILNKIVYGEEALPQNDIKKDHLLIKQVNISKNMITGSWEVSRIETNHGPFGTSEQQTKKIDQQLIRQLISQLKQVMEQDIKDFIKETQE